MILLGLFYVPVLFLEYINFFLYFIAFTILESKKTTQKSGICHIKSQNSVFFFSGFVGAFHYTWGLSITLAKPGFFKKMFFSF